MWDIVLTFFAGATLVPVIAVAVFRALVGGNFPFQRTGKANSTNSTHKKLMPKSKKFLLQYQFLDVYLGIILAGLGISLPIVHGIRTDTVLWSFTIMALAFPGLSTLFALMLERKK